LLTESNPSRRSITTVTAKRKEKEKKERRKKKNSKIEKPKDEGRLKILTSAHARARMS